MLGDADVVVVESYLFVAEMHDREAEQKRVCKRDAESAESAYEGKAGQPGSALIAQCVQGE